MMRHSETQKQPELLLIHMTYKRTCLVLQQLEVKKHINIGFQVTKHPFLIENNEYHRIRHLLNREQQTILKDIALKKRLNMNSLVHVFLTGIAGISKTFTEKELFQMLI
jgi:hypothetical protein